MSGQLHWWQEAVIYQIVVPSFLDTNNDGIGDLPGILQRLEYLQWLGVGALWLTPIYPSPLADLGYDVSDFQNVHPTFGTLDDFDELLAEAHRRQLRLILDWVPNHTSGEHPWFEESRSSRDNPRRDWYFWRDPKPDGSPPNNWISVFGGSAWEWDDATEQFYLHAFLAGQPDLNWRNPDVKAAMFDTLRFWLDRGVDGFRIDAVDMVIKDEQLRDNPLNPDFVEGEDNLPVDRLIPKYNRDQAEIHEILAQLRMVVDEYGEDRIIVGELHSPPEVMMSYYGVEQEELHLPLNLRLNWIDWKASDVHGSIQEYTEHLPPQRWPTWTVATHDCTRMASRREGEQTRIAALLLLTLGGTPTHYYGEEIGMRGTPIPAEYSIDPQGRGTGRNRDQERTPMQWSSDQHAGFSGSEPWLPVTDDFATANVAAQSDNPLSLLTLYRRLIQLRRSEPTMLCGKIELFPLEEPFFAYRRIDGDSQFIVVLNLDGEPSTWSPRNLPPGRVRLSTYLDRENEEVHEQVELRSHEGLLLAIDD